MSHGINVGSRKSDLKLDQSIDIGYIHVIAYDIEYAYDHSKSSGFEYPKLITAAVKCSCHYGETINTVNPLHPGYCDSTEAATETLMNIIIKHSPNFLVAHNGYCFDNLRIARVLVKMDPLSHNT